MTRVFTDEGESIPVTVLEITPNRVTQIKSPDTDGYSALQLHMALVTLRVSTRRLPGICQGGWVAGTAIREFSVDQSALSNYSVGAEITVWKFSRRARWSTSPGLPSVGFRGLHQARHNFSSNRASHGNSVSHNAPFHRYGARSGPSIPGKRMAGHLGAVKTTVQNLTVVRVDRDRNPLLIKGAVPGAKGGDVVVRPSVKAGA